MTPDVDCNPSIFDNNIDDIETFNMNHLASPALGWNPPNQKLTGQMQDNSMFIHFSFYEAV
jgi:hypothetical protein